MNAFDTRVRLPLADAMSYVGAKSDSSFRRWCRINGVRPVRRGIYSRAIIDDAISREDRMSKRPARKARAA